MDRVSEILYLYEDDVESFADGGRIPFVKAGPVKLDPANLKRKQDSLQIYYDKFGKETLDKLSKKRHGKVFNKLSTNDLSNFKRRITKFEDFITENNRMPTEKEARSIGRQPRIKTEQAIQIKLLEETNKGKFFDPEKFAKKNNISMKELKREAGLLQTNIYNKRMKMSGKKMRRVLDWIPDDASVSDNALNKLWKSKLIKYERNKIEELFYDAFGREFVKGTKDKNPNFNPKKHLAIRNNLTEYYKLREAINLKYPNINLALDHPLSKSTLRKVFDATPDQLTRVNPLEADLNNGFKDTLSLQYEKAIQGKNIPQKKAIEKIARDLKLNIGKVNDDATNFKYGVKEFQKLNMKDEVLKAVQTQADLSSNFKNYVKQNPDLFKTANVNPNTNITKVTQSQVKQIEKILTPKHQQLIKNQFCKNAKGGTPGSCPIDEAMDNMIKQTNDVKRGVIKGTEATRIANKASKVVRFGTGKGLGAVLGPLGLAAEAVFEVAFAVPGYARGETGKRLLGDSLLGLIPGVGQSAEEEFDEYATKAGMSELEQQKIKDANRFLELNDALPSAYKNIGKGGRGDPLKGAKNFERLYNEYSPLYDQFVGGPPSESVSTVLAEQDKINQQIAEDKAERAEKRNIAGEEDFMAAGGGIAGIRRPNAIPPESGPQPEGLENLKYYVTNT